MERRSLIILGCGTAAVVFALLCFIVVGDEGPVEVPLEDVADLDVGTLVSVTGRVSGGGVRGGSGFAITEIVDGEGPGLRLFMPFSEPGIGPGDLVRAVGRVGVHGGTVEVVLSSPVDLEVLERSASRQVPLADLLGSPWARGDGGSSVRVAVATPPSVDAGGSGWWCVVSDVENGTVRALAMFVDEPPEELMEVGATADLLVSPRYDGGRGLVYLEVLAVG
jgi:hypothetical protein